MRTIKAGIQGVDHLITVMQNNVLNYLDEIVSRKPDKTAFSDGTDELTFHEVYQSSRAVGTWICQKGRYKEPIVVFMNKHPKTVTAFYGVVTAGCFYVPVDAEMPKMRIELIIKNLNAKVMICDKDTYEIAKGFQFEGEIVIYDEICQTPIDDQVLARVHDSVIDTDLVYVVFTSGSTGIPKGVTGCHRCIIDYVEQLSEVLGFGEDTVFGNQAPLYFDACLKEIYPTLKFGATTYLLPKELFLFPIKLVEFLNKYQINTICWVVSALTMISAFGTLEEVVPEYLHTIAFAGEVFPVKQFERWKKVLPDAVFVNLYGPTEGTGICCYHKVEREIGINEVIPIGRPFKNTEIILLTEKNEQAKAGEDGEICIRGTCVSHGYYGDLERTRSAFVQNPLNDMYPEIIYRTGDIGRYNEYGELVFVSRKDSQIKHMGHRIELGEIEVYANTIEAVELAGCIYDEGRDKIVLYYVGNIAHREMMTAIKDMLPRYMVPNRIIRLEKMPMTANGKIDRVELKKNF